MHNPHQIELTPAEARLINISLKSRVSRLRNKQRKQYSESTAIDIRLTLDLYSRLVRIFGEPTKPTGGQS